MVSLGNARLAKSVLGLALVAAANLSLSACSQEKAETKEVIRPVKVVEITRTDDTRRLDYSGSVRSRTETSLGFRINGKIIERNVDIGDRVKPGDVLARADANDYELAVRSADAALMAANKQVETTDLTRKRAEQLFAKNFASKAQLEAQTLAYEQAVSSRDAAESSLEQAKNQVAYTDLTSNLNGIVTAINADVGQVVGTGTPVVTVAVDGEKEVQIAVPETDIAQFRIGKAVKARFWSDAALVLDGSVREVSGSADAQSRTFAVRVSLPADPRVLLGMTATIEATVDNTVSTISVPLSALGEKDGAPVVWVVDRGAGTVHARPVKVAEFSDDGVRLTDGLQPGDVVVAAGTQFMEEDMKVKLPGGDDQKAASAEPASASGLVR